MPLKSNLKWLCPIKPWIKLNNNKLNLTFPPSSRYCEDIEVWMYWEGWPVTDQWGWLCRDRETERERERDSHHETSHQDALRQEGRLWSGGGGTNDSPGGAACGDHCQDPPLHEFQGDLCRQTRLQETQWALRCPTELNFSKTAKPNVGQIPDYQGKLKQSLLYNLYFN